MSRIDSGLMKRKLFLAPGLFVDFWKRDFAVAGVDAINPGLAFCVKTTLHCCTIWQLNLVGLAGDRLARLIEQFDFHPVTRCGRTCRLRKGLSTGTRVNERNAGLGGLCQRLGSR
jgi:hypothetical protein